MGVTSHLDAYPAESIGGLSRGVSPLEMANAYATLADGGVRNTATAIEKVELPDGSVDTFGRHRSRQFTDGETYEVTKALEGVLDHGTAAGLGIGCPAAGKTGTTSSFTDAWFVGYTPNLSTAVWVGYPKETTSMTAVPGYGEVFGATIPAPDLAGVHDGGQGRRLRRLPAARDAVRVQAVPRALSDGRGAREPVDPTTGTSTDTNGGAADGSATDTTAGGGDGSATGGDTGTTTPPAATPTTPATPPSTPATPSTPTPPSPDGYDATGGGAAPTP